MSIIKSINPYNGATIEEFEEYSNEKIKKILQISANTFTEWKTVSINRRCKLIKKAGDVLIENINKYAENISNEMGKPIKEAKAEVEKCAWVCDFYAKNAEDLLADEIIETDADESFISYDPLGPILAIMPWNFPFWQVFRFAAPNLVAGNVGLLKHSSNVSRCALMIEEIFLEAGLPKGAFQTLLVNSDKIPDIIKDQRIKAVTLTGSEPAGSKVAEVAGKYIKKTVLELGGNNAFIVLKDADINKAVAVGVPARMKNTGQSCIAAKRFILVEAIADEFLEAFKEKVEALQSGDPMDNRTEIGVLAREDLAKDLEKQVNQSVEKGAKILIGGKRKGAYYEPTILTNVQPGMPAFDEELFGPVAAVMIAKNKKEAYQLAQNTKFGLGVSIFSEDTDAILEDIGEFEDGAIFINELVKSDPRLPFGGTKNSGYGRELSKEGIREFLNIKTVYINK